MSLSGEQLSRNNAERAADAPELQKRQEFEKKFRSIIPGALDWLKDEAWPIEQIYVSSPNEEFSLRVRSHGSENGTVYTATLKDDGTIENGLRKRLEIDTPITQAAYEYYAQYQDQSGKYFPRVHKLRADLEGGVTVDFVDGLTTPIVEAENDNQPVDQAALARLLKTELTDETGNRDFDTENLAYILSGETPRSFESLDSFTDRVFSELISRYATSNQKTVVVGLSGMSGSGKTSVTKALEDRLSESFGEQYRPIIISTDDYHRGKAWLEETYGAPWTAWDEPVVYDTDELSKDIQLVKQGDSYLHRHFDFDAEERVYDREVGTSPFILVEGLYAGSADLQGVRNLHFDLPTGVATSVGRDVRRIVIEDRANRAFPTPESRLKYQLETALPTYFEQERPKRNSFSAHTRVLAERAFMLSAITNR